MRLTYITIVATAAILACCDGKSAVGDSKPLAVPQSHVQTGNNANRFLRVHDDEEERIGTQFITSLSDKFASAADKLTRSKSLNSISKVDDIAPGRAGKTLGEVLKIDDVAYLKAAGKWSKNLDDVEDAKLVSELSKLDHKEALRVLDEKNAAAFKSIEDMGYSPDGMFKKMKELGKDYFDPFLLKHYTRYWMAKHPTWTSSL
ncbi:hypothetical protein DVH05_026132 [Phytophthora capsici]|nr:hypothetical protein DVH05_026131 [Phytophthora capsici]KAG1691758.1 hypothetical protein DVH05_026132 [Phytophthora capsici]